MSDTRNDKGTHYADYSDLQPKGDPWPYSFFLKGPKTEEAIEAHRQPVLAWCRDQFGAPCPHDRGRWRYMGRTIRFKRQQDATAFRVMWG